MPWYFLFVMPIKTLCSFTEVEIPTYQLDENLFMRVQSFLLEP